MKSRARAQRRYPTSLTDAQFRLIEPLIPPAKPGGRPREVNPRAIIDAILYLLRSGCAWRMLPLDFPPWGTVHYYFRRWRLEGAWDRIHHALLMADRERAGRQPSPTAAIIDSQSVRMGDQKGVSVGVMRARRSMGAIVTS
jgi:transposase